MNYRNSFLCSILLALALCVLGTQDVARACGGFFCTTAPMDQVGERILFIADKGVVTTHVQIQYNGDASDFACCPLHPSCRSATTRSSASSSSPPSRLSGSTGRRTRSANSFSRPSSPPSSRPGMMLQWKSSLNSG